ncbi:hypothetical protein BHE74_00048575 [Ensete ventricosum]|uniref:Uncharacterized protein n=1 Tax=Ensete ventricosum TaxID=4639 RepID=A0A444F5J4_ENSVE|nr:hypothetical protein B296_00045329 [Ensete ventricosum]RWW17902.1 hypothetical protein GW17_00018145 [Ensete ventricosum]RWW45570.1 hypothetical protein BHE74_00048575 [Ensete ventricosum]RZS21959.1 hypothetical protein BHM03_00054670 [Ensete ventricosum]
MDLRFHPPFAHGFFCSPKPLHKAQRQSARKLLEPGGRVLKPSTKSALGSIPSCSPHFYFCGLPFSPTHPLVYGGGMDAAKVKELRVFVEQCKNNPAVLADPSIAFFRDYLER